MKMSIEKLSLTTPPSRFFQGLSTDYTNNMTYTEFLLGIMKKLNEVIAQTNTHQKFIDEFETQYNKLLEEFDNLREEMDGLEDEITASVNQQLIDFQESVNNQINLLQTYLVAYSDSGDQILQNQIDSIQVGAINIIDPTTGILTPIQEVINNIAGSNANNLTATEYDALELTATTYDSYDISAYDYDFNGKAILV